ncbi:MAG: site-specific integrase [Acidimicrobiales bacterium]
MSIDALVAAAPEARGRLIIFLMFSMGLRCIGVANLRVEDIDYVSKVLIVKEKFGNERRLPITAVVQRAIENYLAECPARTGPLIRGQRRHLQHEGVQAASIGKMVAEWMRAAGIKRYGGDGRNAHALRHTALTEPAEATGDAFLAQELARWSSPATAAHYVRRASTERLRAALAKRDEVQQ